MKKILLLFTLFLLFGCQNILKKTNENVSISCPQVFFSSENNVYIQGDLDSLNLEKIIYKAALNNYSFVKGCFSNNESSYYPLDLLVLVEPINPKDQNINLPIFVILYDKNNNVIDKQYFRIVDNLNYDEETSFYQITDVINKLKIYNKQNIEVDSLTVGFVKIK